MAGKKPNMRRSQPRKDSKSKRVNFDNTRDGKFIKDVEKECRTDGNTDNDISWYSKNPELLKSASSFFAGEVTGERLFPQGSVTEATVPGVMVLNWIPELGGSNTSNMLDSAAESLYSFVVHANSRNTSYTSSDLMMAVLAGANVFAAITNAIRVYGIIKMYDARNQYLPNAILTGMNLDADDFRAHLSDMWFQINNWITQSRQIWIPDVFPLIKRWMWLSQHVFMDGENMKSQFYVFQQRAYLAFSETGHDTGTSLQWANGSSLQDWPDNPSGNTITDFQYAATTIVDSGAIKWSQFSALITQLIDCLVMSEDRGVMMGDILKAYGPDKILALNPIPADYITVPTYNREVLMQIENASIVPYIYNYVGQPNAGKIRCIVNTVRTGALQATLLMPERRIVNFHGSSEPTPEDIVHATRLMVMGTELHGTTGSAIPYAECFCTEIVTQMSMVTLNNVTTSGKYQINVLPAQYAKGTSISQLSYYAEVVFDWSPWLYSIVIPNNLTWATIPAPGTYTFEVSAAVGDYSNYMVISIDMLRKLHAVCLASELDIPTI